MAGGPANTLVVGPWTHGGWACVGWRSSWGMSDFHLEDRECFFRKEIQFPFFEKYLKGREEGEPLPKAYVFETGSECLAEV